MIRRIPMLCAAVGAILLLGLAVRPAPGGGEEPDRSADQTAIHNRTEEFLKALAKGDAKEVAAFWTAGGEYARGEVLPFSAGLNPDPFLVVTGTSLGAYHAVNFACRHPEEAGRVLARKPAITPTPPRRCRPRAICLSGATRAP